MRGSSLVTLGVGALMLVASLSCDDGGAGSSTATGGSGGAGTGGTSSGTTTSTNEPGCYGDQAAWDQLQKTNIPCVKNSDCCVVMNGCLGAGQVVSVSDYPTAGDLWPYCDNECLLCMNPLIELECLDNECVGYDVPLSPDGGLENGQDHCGEDDVAPPLLTPGLFFSCAP